MVLELAREFFEPGGNHLHPGGKKKKKRCNWSQNHHLQDNFFYKMPISSNGIKLSYLFCWLSWFLNWNSKHLLEYFNVLKIISKQTKTHAFRTSYNHFVYEFASQTNLFYLDVQCFKNILQSSHKYQILKCCTNIFELIPHPPPTHTFSVLVLLLVNFKIISCFAVQS